MTYGDGVSDVRIDQLLDFHRQQDTLATLTAVQPPGRFGAFNLDKGQNKIPPSKKNHRVTVRG
jgi:glucose-1-phosphate cytidylyltransferase